MVVLFQVLRHRVDYTHLVWVVFLLECTSSFWALYAAIDSLSTISSLDAVEFIWAFRILGPLCGAGMFVNSLLRW